jgi:hypothetical protein
MGITADENLAVKAGFELAVIVTYLWRSVIYFLALSMSFGTK